MSISELQEKLATLPLCCLDVSTVIYYASSKSLYDGITLLDPSGSSAFSSKLLPFQLRKNSPWIIAIMKITLYNIRMHAQLSLKVSVTKQKTKEKRRGYQRHKILKKCELQNHYIQNIIKESCCRNYQSIVLFYKVVVCANILNWTRMRSSGNIQTKHSSTQADNTTEYSSRDTDLDLCPSCNSKHNQVFKWISKVILICSFQHLLCCF